MRMSQKIVMIGSVLRNHGVHGAMVAGIENRQSIPWNPGMTVFLGNDPEHLVPFVVRKFRFMGKDVRLELDGINDPEWVRKMSGSGLWISADLLKPLPDGSYYHYQLIGLSVQTSAGRDLGRLMDVMKTGANDVFIVGYGKDEYLIPAIPDVIKHVDLESGVMVIEDMPNMLE